MGRIAWFLIAGAAACGDDAAQSPDAAIEMPDAPLPTCATGEISWRFTVRVSSLTGPALVGAQVCLIDPQGPCYDTPTSGEVAFCVRANSRFAISARADGYMPLIAPLVAGTAQPDLRRADTIALNPTSQGCMTWASAGVSCPNIDKALLWVKAVMNDELATEFPPALGGVSITAPAASDIFYANPLKDAALTATDPSWGNAYAVFDADQSAAKVTLTSSQMNQMCHAFSFDAWPVTGDAVEVPVRLGFRTFIAVTCE